MFRTLEARRKPNSGYAEVFIAGTPACIADVYAHEPGSLEWARLIAAAPELLTSLEEFVLWARSCTSPTEPNSPHYILIDAVAAIAKARGDA